MSHARLTEMPQSNLDLGAACLESSAVVAPPRYTPKRGRSNNAATLIQSYLGSYTRVAHLSYGDASTGNALIQGENLRVLSTLKDRYRNSVRCVYIDPPYNNQERHLHYKDSRSHEVWLDMIVARLQAIKPLLSTDGSIWISIDDREMHYLKVAADEVFGRENFVTTIVWQQRTTRENRKVFSNNHEYLLVYAIDQAKFRATRNLLPPSAALLSRYKNPDADPRGSWQSVSANAQAGHATASQFYELVAPSGVVHRPPEGRCWIYTKDKMEREIAAGNIWFGKTGRGVPRIKRFLSFRKPGLTPETLWFAADVGTNDEAKKHLLNLFPHEVVFDTPKPERLIRRVIEIATEPGDLVLDAFLGSGTTTAVAHKLNRKYIGIENGEHAVTYCAARLRKVVDGDPTGISKEVPWNGGGGFDFYK